MLEQLNVGELLDGYRSRTFSPVEVVDALAGRITRDDPMIGAFVTTCLDAAREEARVWEAAYAKAAATPPLAGVPFAAKDIFDTAAVKTSYGSRIFSRHVPVEDAAVIAALREAGAILLGKTQMHEFAWGITSFSPFMGSSRNPWRLDRSPGGSSGGSAAALAAFETPLALGTDTGGSVRIPAAYCGVVGFKPTHGLLPVRGVWPLAPSLDHVGLMARTIEDAALAFAVLSGIRLTAPASSFRVGLWTGAASEEASQDVVGALDDVVHALRHLGGTIVPVEIPSAPQMTQVFGVLQRAEALAVHSEAGLWPSRRPEYGRDVAARLAAAEEDTAAERDAAGRARQRLAAECAAVFDRADILVSLVSGCAPPKVGSDTVLHDGRQRELRDLVMPHTVLHDLVGIPACAVRGGFDSEGLPVGVQIAGPPGADALVLGIARAVQRAMPDVQARWPARFNASAGSLGPNAAEGI